MSEASADNPVMLYDGVCGLCNRTVQIILDQDRRGTMRFAALQSEYGKAVKARHPSLENIDSVVLLERGAPGREEQVYVRSSAALRVASYLGGAWRLLLIFRIVPSPVRDFFYDLIARYRYKIFGRHDACMMPSADVRSRFLDL